MLNLAAYEKQHSIQSKDIVPIVRAAGFDKYSKQLHAHAKNPRSGIELVDKAAESIIAAFGPVVETAEQLKPSGSPTHEKKGYPCRVYARLTKTDYRALQRALKRLGYSTLQDGVLYIIRKFIIEQKEASNV